MVFVGLVAAGQRALHAREPARPDRLPALGCLARRPLLRLQPQLLCISLHHEKRIVANFLPKELAFKIVPGANDAT